MSVFPPVRLAVCGLTLMALGACALPEVAGRDRPDMGAFRLGHTVVVARNAQALPLSRPAGEQEWKDLLGQAVAARLGDYDGTRFYHLAIHVDGFVLAVPGLPVVASPKSVLVISVTAWDDAAGGKINEDPHQITVFETLSGGTVLGSGLTQTREQQIAGLSRNAARAIHDWLLEHPQWFASDEIGGPEDAGAAAAAGVN